MLLVVPLRGAVPYDDSDLHDSTIISIEYLSKTIAPRLTPPHSVNIFGERYVTR